MTRGGQAQQGQHLVPSPRVVTYECEPETRRSKVKVERVDSRLLDPAQDSIAHGEDWTCHFCKICAGLKEYEVNILNSLNDLREASRCCSRARL